jgi:pimeloyl-ACP methyl ester carboxylesterase
VSRFAVVVAIAALIAVGGSSCGSFSRSADAPTTGRLTLKACRVHGFPARCGSFVVPENHSKPSGRTIGLRVVVLPALLKPVANDAFTYLAGGPGDAVTQETADLGNELIDLNEHHDILLVDQRGTGSTAYTCAGQTTTTPFSSNAELRNHTQVYLKLHPSSVRTLILVAGTAIDVRTFGRWAVNAQRALDQVAAICDSQPACRKAFPNWERQFGELVKAWNAHPVHTGSGVIMTGDKLAGIVHVMLLDTEKATSIPLVVSRAAQGVYAPLNRQGPGDLSWTGLQLMAWSIWCNEPWTGLDTKPPWGTEFDTYTATKIADFRRGCTFFPKRAEPDSLWTFHPTSTVPVLAVECGADPQDPPTNLASLKRHFPDSRIVILPHIGHEFNIGGCVDAMIFTVINRATTKGLDTTLCNSAILVPQMTLTG